MLQVAKIHKGMRNEQPFPSFSTIKRLQPPVLPHSEVPSQQVLELVTFYVYGCFFESDRFVHQAEMEFPHISFSAFWSICL